MSDIQIYSMYYSYLTKQIPKYLYQKMPLMYLYRNIF